MLDILSASLRQARKDVERLSILEGPDRWTTSRCKKPAASAPVSRQIAGLEAELDVPLSARSTWSMLVTADGQRV
jgi:hypothetical protein